METQQPQQQPINPELPKYKLIFLGDQGVGKSCILNRFMNDTFSEEYQATIGLDFQSKNVQIDNQDIHLLLYDTAGQEKFRSLIPMYTRDANIILLVYDVTSKESFNNLSIWLNDLNNIKKEEVIFAVVGNKTDLDDRKEVNSDEGENFAKEHDFIFAEISAKTGDGFSELFYKNLFEKIRTKFRPGGQQPNSEVKDFKFNIEQRINLAKEAELLERKIKKTDINKDNEILTSYPNIPDINSSKPTKPFLDNKLFYNYNLSLNEIKKESKSKDYLTNSLNNKENIITNKK